MAAMPPEKLLHGNNARIHPRKHVESLYQTNLVTYSEETEGETPVSSDENVAYAKKFVDENKK
jgi:hypothetical protein